LQFTPEEYPELPFGLFSFQRSKGIWFENKKVPQQEVNSGQPTLTYHSIGFEKFSDGNVCLNEHIEVRILVFSKSGNMKSEKDNGAFDMPYP
jgi:hypothetical protein